MVVMVRSSMLNPECVVSQQCESQLLALLNCTSGHVSLMSAYMQQRACAVRQSDVYSHDSISSTTSVGPFHRYKVGVSEFTYKPVTLPCRV